MTMPQRSTSSFARALVYSGGASALAPLFGLLTAPLLSHSLGVSGRGAVSAALAPALLLSGLATLGMPEAVTYFRAGNRMAPRKLLLIGVLSSCGAGVIGLGAVAASADLLAGAVPGLATLILLATALSLPTLVVSVARGLAIGAGQWHLVAIERLLNAILRLASLAALFATGNLSVFGAVLVLSCAPLVSGLVYFGVLSSPASNVESGLMGREQLPSILFLRYGFSTWVGTAAVVLLARMSQLVVTPLSNVDQLGLLAVAITVADIPFLLATAVRDAAFGVFSANIDRERLASASRLTVLVTTGVSFVLGTSMPFWVVIAFGPGFDGAVLATWITLVSQIVSVPYLIVGAGLAADGRPFIRSLAIVLSLAVNVALLVLLVPQFGASGAAVSGLIGNVIALTVILYSARQTFGLSVRDLILPNAADVLALKAAALRLLGLWRKRARSRSQS